MGSLLAPTLASLSFFALAVLPGSGLASTSSKIATIAGAVTGCVASPSGVQLSLETSRGQFHTTLTESDLHPGLPSDYRRLVGPVYAMTGACPARGERAVVTYCGSCGPPNVHAVEVDGDGARDGPGRLWLVRQFFDRAATDADSERVNLFATSMILARHNRQDGRKSYTLGQRPSQAFSRHLLI